MSIFTAMDVRCPACGTPNTFEAVRSVNADRRPDYRAAILEESFQQARCSACTTSFRLDPNFAYVNADRGQWISARPLDALADWKDEEVEARRVFDRIYGSDGSPGSQAIGRSVRPRVTFGWAGLREKLVIVAHGLDDVSIELAKAALIRGSSDAPLRDGIELRLMGVEAKDGALVFAWLQSSDESQGPMQALARSVYDDVHADADGDWADLRTGIDAGLYVDLNRLMLADA